MKNESFYPFYQTEGLETEWRDIQRKLWCLLARQAKRYTLGDSGSIPLETGEELFSSICFTLKLYESENGTSSALFAGADLDALLREGVKLIEKKLALGKGLYREACLSAPKIENIAYGDTLRNIGGFFQRYDYRFFAHQIPCAMDYPLAQPVPESLLGIEYINEYLRRTVLENHFLQHFDTSLLIRLLEAYCPDYKGLLINLYEPVAANALALALLGGDVFVLDIDATQQARLQELFFPLPGEETQAALAKAAALLCCTLNIREGAAQAYLMQTAKALSPRIRAALSGGSLAGLFLSLTQPAFSL